MTSLPMSIIKEVLNYCERYVIPAENPPQDKKQKWFFAYFDFVENASLRRNLGYAFYQARFVQKLMTALKLDGWRLIALVKFQIIQYASIYEAVIDYFIETKYVEHPEIVKILEYDELREVPALSKSTKIIYTDANGNVDGDELVTCKKIKKRLKLKEVRFSHKVDAAVKIGFIQEVQADSIKELYEKRNMVHLNNAAVKNYIPDIGEGKQAFEMLSQFTSHIRKTCR
jgi:hypothetical protein